MSTMRLTTLAVLLGLAGCAFGSDPPDPEPTGKTSEALSSCNQCYANHAFCCKGAHGYYCTLTTCPAP